MMPLNIESNQPFGCRRIAEQLAGYLTAQAGLDCRELEKLSRVQKVGKAVDGMDWTEVCIRVATADTDRASDIAHMDGAVRLICGGLQRCGAGGAGDRAYRPDRRGTLARDRTHSVLHLYLPPDENPAEAVAFLRERYAAAGIDNEVMTSSVKEEDWAYGWKAYFKPLPGRSAAHSADVEPRGRCRRTPVLTIDPGMAFGTGGHDTTNIAGNAGNGGKARMHAAGWAAAAVFVHRPRCCSVQKQAVGVDIDPLAVRTAVENGQLNGFFRTAADHPGRRSGRKVEAPMTWWRQISLQTRSFSFPGDSPFLKPDGVIYRLRHHRHPRSGCTGAGRRPVYGNRTAGAGAAGFVCAAAMPANREGRLVEDWRDRTQMLIGEKAVNRLAHSAVAVFGLGGVGSFAAEELARAGVGRLVLVDGDTVSLTNPEPSAGRAALHTGAKARLR